MNLILACLQLGTGALMIGTLMWLIPRSITRLDVRHGDERLPFSQQRVRIRDTGEKDFVPRANIWAAILVIAILAVGWVVICYYYGFLYFRG